MSHRDGVPGDRIRVLVGMPFGDALGGSERILRSVARRAGAHGLELEAVFFASGELERELAGMGITTRVLPLGRFRHLRTGAHVLTSLKRLVRERRPDVVLSWLPRAHVYMSPAALLAGTGARIALWQHHVPTGDSLDRLTTAMPATAIVCVSQAVADSQRALRPRRRCIVCHPGIDPPEPLPTEQLDALRSRLAIPPERVVVGVPGRLMRWKGQDRFLHALRQLLERGHDAHGIVVGGSSHGIEPEFTEELEILTRRLGLEARCTFTGQVDDPIPYIQLMDVLVSPSVGEGFGLTLLEAMALGVPVVAVDRGGPREIVVHERSGLLVGGAEPEALASGVARLIENDELREGLAAGGLARYEERFTADAHAERAARALWSLARASGDRRAA